MSLENMACVLFHISILGLLLILVYFSPLGSNDMNAFGSVSEDDDTDGDDSTVEQPAEQPLPSKRTLTYIATSIYDTHEFNAGDGVNKICLF